MAEGEVILEGIFRIETFEALGDLYSHVPILGISLREAETAAYASDVGIQGHDQSRLRYILPETEIDVPVAYHPSQKQVHPLAGTAFGRQREELEEPGSHHIPPVNGRRVAGFQRFDETGHSDADVLAVLTVMGFEDMLEAAVFSQGSSRDVQQTDNVLGSVEPVPQAGEEPSLGRGAEGAQEVVGALTHHREDAGDNGLEKFNLPIGE